MLSEQQWHPVNTHLDTTTEAEFGKPSEKRPRGSFGSAGDAAFARSSVEYSMGPVEGSYTPKALTFAFSAPA